MPKKSIKPAPKLVTEKKSYSFWKWLDNRALLLLSGFLLAFIPLFPKLPLFDIIPGYIVRVRLEDFFVIFTCIVWAVQIFRKKVEWKTKMTYVVIAYAVVGLLSTLSAIFITKTVPFETLHIGKTLLHYFRYLEYFTLFFIVYSAIKTRDDIIFLLKVIIATVIGVGLYGVGQKYLYWPVYSTMNREFSKGLRLYLTEHARVQSTFGGHYDLAAYLVIITPLVMSFLYTSKKKLHSFFLWIAFLLCGWMLIVSASRTSFFSFLVSSFFVLTFLTAKKPNLKEKCTFFTVKSLQFVVILWILIANFGADMYERLMQTLEAYPTLWNTYHSINGQRKDLTKEMMAYVNLNTFKFNVEKPKDAISTDELDVMVKSDQQPAPEKPSDVYVDVPDKVKVATVSETGEVEIIEVEQPRTYSQNALQHGLSLAIRLDTLWPRALAGFNRNPLLGSGYATLTKENNIQFTEAESTDNNYLRTLGETGLLGFITFYGAVVLMITISIKMYKNNTDLLSQALSVGFFAATIGLLINATYIDVFAASKVAFTFWGITGILYAYYHITTNKKALNTTQKRV